MLLFKKCIFESLGKPTPIVKWYKEGKEIDDNYSENLIIYFDESNGSASLTIKKATLNDSAKYTCVARNALGSCSTSASIKVQGINITLIKCILITF